MLRAVALAALFVVPTLSQANPHRSATSADGAYVAVADDEPPGLQILGADRRPIKMLPAPGRIASVVHAASRKSFLVGFNGAAELWEVSYDPNAEPIAEGVVHDFRLKEGTLIEGFLNPRRTRLDQPLEDLFFIQQGSLVAGVQRDGAHVVVIQLDVRRPIASLELPGRPRVSASRTCTMDGRRMMATPDRHDATVSIIDLDQWKVVASPTAREACR